MKKKAVAIVLAAGQGKRMGSEVKKQFLELNGRPLLYYSLTAFEKSTVDEIVLVTAAEDLKYCQEQIIEAYALKKVTAVIPGGIERYHSVYAGLNQIDTCDYVLIHDGARPLVPVSVIEESLTAAAKYAACVVGTPVKDTIKVVDEQQQVISTPDRDMLWTVQTPQVFAFDLVYQAYIDLMKKGPEQYHVTDDAMVVEIMTKTPAKLIHGSYSNIKITTSDDMVFAEMLLKKGEI